MSEWRTDKPTKKGKYLATIKSLFGSKYIDILNYGQPTHHLYGGSDEWYWYRSDDEYEDIIYENGVLAWQELPKEYKEKQKKKYINKDELKKAYKKWYELYSWGEGTDGEKATIRRAIQILDEQPTANVRENIKGEWVKADKGWQCLCGYTYYGLQTNFCPNCGADMRGGTDDKGRNTTSI